MGHWTLRRKIVTLVLIIMAIFLIARGVSEASQSYNVYVHFLVEEARSTAQTLAVVVAQHNEYWNQPAQMQELLLALRAQADGPGDSGLVGRGIRGILVTNADIEVVAATEPSMIHARLSGEARRALASVLDDGIAQTFQLSTATSVTNQVAVPIEIDGHRQGAVVVQYFQDPARVLATVNAMGEAFIIVVVTMGLMLILLVGMRKMVVQPLVVLEEGAACLGEGNLDARIELKTGDELQVVAHAFNRMAGSLKARQAQHVAEAKRAALIQIAQNTAGEFSQPLTVVLGYTELLHEQEAQDPEFLDEALHAIRRGVRTMTNIVRKLSNMQEDRYTVQNRPH